MVDVGIDESQSGSTLVVSAIVGNSGQLQKLDTEWRRELDAKGVDFFHAKEHWNGHAKPYHGISVEEREQLLARLVCHFHRRFMFGASVLIDQSEFTRAASERLRSQYWFQSLMMLVNMELTRVGRQNQPVNILIEDGHVNANQAIGFIKHKTELDPTKGLRIGTYGLGKKHGRPILQAADLLAFTTREWKIKGSSDFASRLFPKKYAKRFCFYNCDTRSVHSVVFDIERHRFMRKAGVPGAKRIRDLVMW